MDWHPDATSVLFAGDIMDGVDSRSIDWVLESCEGLHGFMTLGNHELYGIRRDKAIRELMAGFDNTHVKLLVNESTVVDGVRIAGTDLWTDFALMGDPKRAMERAGQAMNDYRKVRFKTGFGRGAHFRKVRPSDTLNWHSEARQFIARTLETSEEPVLLMTHHAPSGRSIPDEYRGNALSPAYASDLDHFYAEFARPPVVNIHGHIHRSQYYRMPCGTFVASNTGGYHGVEAFENFDSKRLIRIGRDRQVVVEGYE